MNNTKLNKYELKHVSFSFFSAIDRIIWNRSYLHIFFQSILSNSEYRNILLRWEILRMLSQRISQREIASRLGVSLTKITRASFVLQDLRGRFSEIRPYIAI